MRVPRSDDPVAAATSTPGVRPAARCEKTPSCVAVESTRAGVKEKDICQICSSGEGAWGLALVSAAGLVFVSDIIFLPDSFRQFDISSNLISVYAERGTLQRFSIRAPA